MTNGDKIRQMTDEELAKNISKISIFDFCSLICGGECKAVNTFDSTSEQKCVDTISNWLKQEEEDEKEEST